MDHQPAQPVTRGGINTGGRVGPDSVYCRTIQKRQTVARQVTEPHKKGI
jgi:hypothetical protein